MATALQTKSAHSNKTCKRCATPIGPPVAHMCYTSVRSTDHLLSYDTQLYAIGKCSAQHPNALHVHCAIDTTKHGTWLFSLSSSSVSYNKPGPGPGCTKAFSTRPVLELWWVALGHAVILAIRSRFGSGALQEPVRQHVTSWKRSGRAFILSHEALSAML